MTHKYLILGAKATLFYVAAFFLETKIWDIGPGIAGVLVAIVGLGSAWIGGKLREIHSSVNSTATALKEESRADKETILRLTRENGQLQSKLDVLVERTEVKLGGEQHAS